MASAAAGARAAGLDFASAPVLRDVAPAQGRPPGRLLADRIAAASTPVRVGWAHAAHTFVIGDAWFLHRGR